MIAVPSKLPHTIRRQGLKVTMARIARSRRQTYEKRTISWFSPVETSAGVLNPPIIA